MVGVSAYWYGRTGIYTPICVEAQDDSSMAQPLRGLELDNALRTVRSLVSSVL